MKAYLPKPEQGSDYENIRRNGMWYQHWQSGYLDILKKGHPKPEDQNTILAKLYSPHTDDFLHDSSGAVPFLISERALAVFQEAGFTGYRLASVEVVKVASKGLKKRKEPSGEPEDAILGRRDLKGDVTIPKLHAVYVTGRVKVAPDFPSGRSPSGYVSPFDLFLESQEVPDLFRPEFNGQPFSAWAFCSDRFHNIVNKAGLTNIRFEAFEIFMEKFRAKNPTNG